jgi:hypothetical protein
MGKELQVMGELCLKWTYLFLDVICVAKALKFLKPSVISVTCTKALYKGLGEKIKQKGWGKN